MKRFAIIGLFILVGCGSMMQPVERVSSPSGSFVIAAIPNESKDDPTKYRCIRLILQRQDGSSLSAVQTNASDSQKWTVGWMASGDIVVLQSDDIGTKAFKVESNKLMQIPVTPDIKKRGAELKKEKYK